jgi:carbonyl reductase 1
VAVVTGSNKGIGYAIVKGLCEKFDGDVYLTARDSGRGQAAVEKLRALGYNPLFHQLDISDKHSVDTFRDYLKSKHGGLDVLINNAAIAFQADATEPISVQAEKTIRINYYGTKRVCETLFPILRENARVINVSSSAGHLSNIRSDDLRTKFHHEKLTYEGLNKLMDKFVEDAKAGKHDVEWGDYLVAYVVSKVGISCLSFIQQRLLDAEIPNRNISVNSVHPGYIETDMTTELRQHRDGAKSIEEGAKPPLFLALEANLKGQYVWKDCTVVDWYAPSIDGMSRIKNIFTQKN